MPVLSKAVLDFDDSDVRMLDKALAKFWQLRGNGDYPDWSPGAHLYAPILSLVLLRSQDRVEQLTRAVVALTVALVILTVAMLALTIVQ